MSEFVGLSHMTPEDFIELKARAEAAEARVSVLEGILDRAHEIVLTRDALVAELEETLRREHNQAMDADHDKWAHLQAQNDTLRSRVAELEGLEVESNKLIHMLTPFQKRALQLESALRECIEEPACPMEPSTYRKARALLTLRCRICSSELGQPHTRCVYSSIIVSAHETHEPSLASAFGAWPGEETDEELRKAMKEPK